MCSKTLKVQRRYPKLVLSLCAADFGYTSWCTLQATAFLLLLPTHCAGAKINDWCFVLCWNTIRRALQNLYGTVLLAFPFLATLADQITLDTLRVLGLLIALLHVGRLGLVRDRARLGCWVWALLDGALLYSSFMRNIFGGSFCCRTLNQSGCWIWKLSNIFYSALSSWSWFLCALFSPACDDEELDAMGVLGRRISLSLTSPTTDQTCGPCQSFVNLLDCDASYLSTPMEIAAPQRLLEYAACLLSWILQEQACQRNKHHA